MASDSTHWDERRAIALFYALSLRIAQCQQICAFPHKVRPFYDINSYISDEEPTVTGDCIVLLRKWSARPIAIVNELRPLIESSNGTTILREILADLTRAVGEILTVEKKFFEFHQNRKYGELSVGVDVCLAAKSQLMILARALDQERSITVLEPSVELGKQILRFQFAEEVAYENADDDFEQETWDEFDFVWINNRRLKRSHVSEYKEAVRPLASQLQLRLNELFPPLSVKDRYQCEIQDLEYIPTNFSGWFQIEAGLWRLIYGKRAKRPCAERDARFVRWKLEESSKQPNKYVLDRWNALSDVDRKKIAPECCRKIRLATVKEVLKIAEIRAKAEQYDRLTRIF